MQKRCIARIIMLNKRNTLGGSMFYILFKSNIPIYSTYLPIPIIPNNLYLWIIQTIDRNR